MSVEAPAKHPLRGSSVLLAGASGGLGRALAAEIHRRGGSLTMVGRSAERLATVGTPGMRHAIDLERASGCDEAVARAIDHAGRLDVVINAVGVVAFGRVEELSDEVLEQLFRTNVFLPMMLARAALERIEPGGAIVNISGVVAERPLPGMAAYAATKTALRGFDEALAREVRGVKVRVIDARPPHTETGLAGRPLEGVAPAMPDGASPELVATVICDALERGARELGSADFQALAEGAGRRGG
jgi:cyclic-di-GMP-binding biofilm dispersal mediator protein